MQYSKQPLSFGSQIVRLKSRGLTIKDEDYAKDYLSRISYYRLRAYTYPFQDNNNPDHPFIKEVTFEQIIDLYAFDHLLRTMIFGAFEKIEIALRTQIIYQWSIRYGSHWQIDPNLYRDPVKFSKHISSLQNEIDRSNETFIEHYNNTYSQPTVPPSWMSLEVSSFGLLSNIFANLKKGPAKESVTKYFGLNDVGLMENWMHCFSNIRNICAHHCRLWNRRLTSHIKIPTNPKYDFLQYKPVLAYKIYPALCCIEYILRIISPSKTLHNEIINLMDNCPREQEHEMGFPKQWRSDSFWA